MMIGEPHQCNPTVYVSPWAGHHTNHTFPISCPFSDNVSNNISPATPNNNNHNHVNYDAILTALQRYLPSNTAPASVGIADDSDLDLLPEVYTSDEFRMYDFKVRKCTRAGSHDWTDCPFVHPGEKARRRDPRKYNYSGTACTDFRKGGCRKGDGCEFAHGVFECWLHPTRYRTQACKDGPNCQRRVCFFAHAPEQLRIIGSTGGQQQQPPVSRGGNSSPDPYEDMFGAGSGSITASPSMTPVMESPPLTPMAASSLSRSIGSSSISDLVASLRQLQLSKVKSMPANSWNVNVQLGSPRFAACSPNANGTGIRPGFFSLPCTPTRPGYGYSDSMWEMEMEEGRPLMERVESGRELRARIFEKLSKENPLRRPDPGEGMKGLPPSANGPDVGWVSDLVQ